MSRRLLCDVCGKPCEHIVGKLFFAPMTRANGAKSFHNNYQLHLDVGECCELKLKKAFRWQRRKTAKEYHARGKRVK